jgi:dihydropteroate synthase
MCICSYKTHSVSLLMATYNPMFISIDSLEAAKKEIKSIGSDPKSIEIMAPKMVSKVIKLHTVVLQDAIILKQDMLSLGGEVVIPRDAFELKERSADILVVGTVKQLQELVGKLQRHYPRIQKIASEIAVLIQEIS